MFDFALQRCYLLLSKTEIYRFETYDDIRWYEFCLESVSKGFIKDEQNEISLNGIVYDFSVDHSSRRYTWYLRLLKKKVCSC